jgi:hypothetical protein
LVHILLEEEKEKSSTHEAHWGFEQKRCALSKLVIQKNMIKSEVAMCFGNVEKHVIFLKCYIISWNICI